MNTKDKAGVSYWDSNWEKADIPCMFNPQDQSLDNHVKQQLHIYFQKLLKNKKRIKILEIGCANSIWPIYFYQHHGAQVFGLDYSEVGCSKSRAIFKHYNVPGKVYCEDFFNPSAELLNKFDLVVSFGVVEHFENTSECLQACSAFVKPDGLLLTLIPNMPSLIGFIQKRIDRAVYDVHMPLTKKKFLAAHQRAELTLIECNYFMFINLGVVNSGKFSTHPLNKYLRRALSASSKIFWMLERMAFDSPKILSHHLI